MKNHIYTGMVVILLILVCFIMGCSDHDASPNIVVKSSYQLSAVDALLKDPIPITAHFDLVNTGDRDGKNVQVEVEILYKNEVVKKEVIYFGTIKAGDSKVKDEVIPVPKPSNFNKNFLDMKINLYVDGKLVNMREM